MQILRSLVVGYRIKWNCWNCLEKRSWTTNLSFICKRQPFPLKKKRFRRRRSWQMQELWANTVYACLLGLNSELLCWLSLFVLSESPKTHQSLGSTWQGLPSLLHLAPVQQGLILSVWGHEMPSKRPSRSDGW